MFLQNGERVLNVSLKDASKKKENGCGVSVLPLNARSYGWIPVLSPWTQRRGSTVHTNLQRMHVRSLARRGAETVSASCLQKQGQHSEKERGKQLLQWNFDECQKAEQKRKEYG